MATVTNSKLPFLTK